MPNSFSIKPFYSVLIPTYNRAEKISRAIRSVLNQSFDDFELLVMDDGSNDNTKEVVQGFSDPRITYYWAENTGGPATPRNRGIEASLGDWICFLDADDLWYPNKLDEVKCSIDQYPDVDIICHNARLSKQGSDYEPIIRFGPYVEDFYRVMLVNGNRLGISATVLKRSFIDEHHLRFNQSPDYISVEDYDLWLRIALYGGCFHFISKTLGEYSMADDNISLSNKHRINWEVLLREHVYTIQSFQPDKDKLWEQISSMLLLEDSLRMLREWDIAQALRVCCTAMIRSPKSGVLLLSSWLKRKSEEIFYQDESECSPSS